MEFRSQASCKIVQIWSGSEWVEKRGLGNMKNLVIRITNETQTSVKNLIWSIFVEGYSVWGSGETSVSRKHRSNYSENETRNFGVTIQNDGRSFT